MAPKKATSSEPTEGGKFTWEGANENKLLLIILGRHITKSDHEEIAQAIPGATAGAIRNRVGILRAKQKKLYEDLGWEAKLPGQAPSSTPASAKKAKTTLAKRAFDADANDEEAEPETTTPSKKPRATPRKKKDGKAKTKVEDSEAEDGLELGGHVKKEEEMEEI